MLHNRVSVSQDLKEFLIKQKDVLAAWEGGSAATGFLDTYSDLDLSIVCQDDVIETIIKAIEEFLNHHYGILRRYRIPEPAWHGQSQIFVQIKESEPLFYLDIAFIKKSNPNKLMESDRHGKAVIWFEKEPLYNPQITSKEVALARCKNFYKIATDTDFITLIEIKKNIQRHLFLEAFPSFYGFVVRNLGLLLNLKYRPAKVDFGLRYAYRDYAKVDRDLIEQCMQVASLDQLEKQLVLVEERFHQLKAELKSKYE